MVESASLRDRVLIGRYRLEERLGAGGMGTIWRATHLVLAAPVAVKLLDREIGLGSEAAARFMREAQAAAALRSPHVVQILDYGVDEQLPFIVMELLEGENLAQRLKRVRRLNAASTARIVTQIGRAIGRAHDAGIVHRDLKPENVFLVRNEDEELAKVLDFGVAKVDSQRVGSEGTRTRTGSILGTPYYMSPEQAQGNKTVDHRSDLWALGVIAFECLTGTRPFYSDGLGDLVLQICIRDLPVPSLRASVPLGFDQWFSRAVSREPDERFQSAREMTDALREALGVETRDESPPPEVLISSREAPGREGPPSSDSREVSSQSSVRAANRLTADQHAATLPASSDAAPPAASSDDARRTASTAPDTPDPEPSRGRRRVLFVGAGALLLGVGVGVVMMQARRRAPPPPMDVREEHPRSAEREPATPNLNPGTPPAETASSAAAAAEAPSAPPAEDGTALEPDAKPRPSAGAVEREAGAADAPKLAGSAAHAPNGAASADAGWVKPAWAIPDEEPPRAPETPNTNPYADPNP